jgi:hypothetical protein
MVGWFQISVCVYMCVCAHACVQLWVLWRNALPSRHIFEREMNDTSSISHCGLFAGGCSPQVRTVVHLHGGHTIPQYDGYADSWFTQDTPIAFDHVDRMRSKGQGCGSAFFGRDYCQTATQHRRRHRQRA